MGDQQVTQAELGWLAGILDGEGYVGLRLQVDTRKKLHRYINPFVSVTNTDEAIILRIHEIAKRLGASLYIRACKACKNGKKDYFVAQSHKMTHVLLLLAPVMGYMTGEKRERAELVVRFCKLRKSNEGIRNPDIGNGKRGAGRIYPYTTEEWGIFEKCAPMMRRGTSEAIREARRQTSEIWALMDSRAADRMKP